MIRYICLISVCTLVLSCNTQIGAIDDPYILGTPPCNAYEGLVQLDDGEIRHYNYAKNNLTKEAYYLRSLDQGESWDTVMLANKYIGADEKSPLSGEYIRLVTAGNSLICTRSEGGIDGNWIQDTVYTATPEEGQYIMLKPPVFVRKGRRMLVGAHSTKRFGCGVFYSDDDGQSWKRSQFVNAPPHEPGGLHKSYRWNHGAVEPTVVELNDGRIWMLARTAQDQHYEAFSSDGGETWSELKPSRFYATITMPTIKRLKDGRLLFLWNNSTPLPEEEGNMGNWEDVFTNRDVLHAAISEDDGKTWIGFRELILNPRRNLEDFAVSDQRLSLDMSVHQNQFIELGDNKILVALGQHHDHRKFLKFNLDWLYKKSRDSDFSQGLQNWTTHLYQKGVVGHCAYNRAAGAQLIPHPIQPNKKVLKIACTPDSILLVPNQGAVWNFPALNQGIFECKLMIPSGSQGGRISLTDRWFNACDTTAYHFSMFNFDLNQLPVDVWHKLRFEWDLDRDAFCTVLDQNHKQIAKTKLNFVTQNGISYVHFISSASRPDQVGFYIEQVRAE